MKNKLVCCVGINDADYVVQIKETVGYDASGKRIQRHTWRCPFYSRWVHMLKRCYGTRSKNPSYEGCTVCEDWKYFSKFRAWMEKQEWEGKELDKDLLCPGNKVYTPKLCIFVPKEVNAFLTDRRNDRGECKRIGVSKHGEKYRARISNSHVGIYETEQEAFDAWLTAKREKARMLASQQSDPLVADALIKFYENYKEIV